MIELTKGNLLESNAEALVNTVNCVGHMGKGIALQFKQAIPENFKAYQKACKAGQVQPGKMFVFDRQTMFNPKYIINFPTKRHWRGKAKLQDVQDGLAALVEEIKKLDIQSIAIPPLGCGLGGLEWNQVRPLIEQAFSELPHIHVLLFAPEGAPDAKTMPVRTKRPKMTNARALLIILMEQYMELDYRLTLLEIQKLAYFLQVAGEPLQLRFEAGKYGPYAHNLNKVLERLEGHFIRGVGDSQKPDQDIELLPGAIEEADRFLKEQETTNPRLRKVSELIEVFETPYGMELLASLYWVAKHQEAATVDEAIQKVHAWNERKRNMLREDHIRLAWEQLQTTGWLPNK